MSATLETPSFTLDGQTAHRAIEVLERLRQLAPDAGGTLLKLLESSNLVGAIEKPRGYLFHEHAADQVPGLHLYWPAGWEIPDEEKYPQTSFWCAGAIKAGISVDDLLRHLGLRETRVICDGDRKFSYERLRVEDPFLSFVSGLRGGLDDPNVQLLSRWVIEVFGPTI